MDADTSKNTEMATDGRQGGRDPCRHNHKADKACDLDHFVRSRGPMPIAQAIDCLVQAARQLEDAHARGIIHGDLKPGNLIIDTAGSVRVLGLTPELTGDQENSDVTTGTGRVRRPSATPVDTAQYMAPELAGDKAQVDHRADIFSLGCTLFFLLTARAPFPDETTAKSSQAHREREAPSLGTVRPDVPVAIDACYRKMTARRPDDRPRSMTEVIALLKVLAGASEPLRTVARPLKRSPVRAWSNRWRHPGSAVFALAAAGLLAAAFVGMIVLRRTPTAITNESAPPSVKPDARANTHPVQPAPLKRPEPVRKTIFDGTSGRGWMLCNRAPLPPQNIQPDGLNPHRSGSYLVVYAQKLGDFVLDFDYKLARGCNSGVFLRVNDLNNPVQTGIEVSLDDARRGDDRDSGGFHGLLAPSFFAQKPSGQWNHMTITARGPRLAVLLNEQEVSSLDLDLWTDPGKRPDRPNHQSQDRATASMARIGYLGFQDLGSDCWFKNIVVTENGAS